jgi:DNA-binding GntR family transcriptional regulator
MPAEGVLEPLRTPSVVEGVVSAIREAITEQRYQPGEHLVERRVAAELGVSTIAIREAFSQLAEEGLVERRPRRGTHVTAMSYTALRDITRVRIALEELVVEVAIENWTPEARADVQSIVDEMASAVRRRDTDELFDLDNQFHEKFWQIAASETLLEVSANLRGRIRRFLLAADKSLRPDELEVMIAAHQAWLDAVDSGDLDWAKAEARRQIMVAFERISTRILPSMAAAREMNVDGPAVGAA